MLIVVLTTAEVVMIVVVVVLVVVLSIASTGIVSPISERRNLWERIGLHGGAPNVTVTVTVMSAVIASCAIASVAISSPPPATIKPPIAGGPFP